MAPETTEVAQFRLEHRGVSPSFDLHILDLPISSLPILDLPTDELKALEGLEARARAAIAAWGAERPLRVSQRVRIWADGSLHRPRSYPRLWSRALDPPLGGRGAALSPPAPTHLKVGCLHGAPEHG